MFVPKTQIPIRHRIVFTHVLDEFTSHSKVKDMQKNLTKKLFIEKVLKELRQHPYYLENKAKFDKVIDKFQKMNKQMAITDILSLLEENFHFKVQHKKKFKHVLEEMNLHFHKQKYQNVMQELQLHFHKQKFEPVLEELMERHLIENFNVFDKHPDRVDHFLAFFFLGIITVQLFGIVNKMWWSDI